MSSWFILKILLEPSWGPCLVSAMTCRLETANFRRRSFPCRTVISPEGPIRHLRCVFICVPISTYTHRCAHTHTQRHTCAHTQRRTCAHTQAHVRARTQTHSETHVRAHTHTLRHARTQHTHTCTHLPLQCNKGDLGTDQFSE